MTAGVESSRNTAVHTSATGRSIAPHGSKQRALIEPGDPRHRYYQIQQFNAFARKRMSAPNGQAAKVCVPENVRKHTELIKEGQEKLEVEKYKYVEQQFQDLKLGVKQFKSLINSIPEDFTPKELKIKLIKNK